MATQPRGDDRYAQEHWAQHGRSRSICICVDDVGLHPGINIAAIRLAAMGRVHAMGCMVGGSAFRPWTRSLRRLGSDGVDIGLHLDLTESPLLRLSRRSLKPLIAASYLRLLNGTTVRAEIRAQLDMFEQAIGKAPSFVDGHQHVHQLPIVRDELLEEMAYRYGSTRPWLRSTRGAGSGTANAGMQDAIKPWLIGTLGGRGLAAIARRRGYLQNQRLLGVYDFRGGTRRYSELLAAWLRSANDADLLMCHPSVRLEIDDPLIEARCAEYEVLSSTEFGSVLVAAGVTLGPMSRILAGTNASR